MLGWLLLVFFAFAEQSGTPRLFVRVVAVAPPGAKDRIVARVSVLPERTSGPALTSQDVVIADGEGRAELPVPAGQYVIRTATPGFWAPDHPVNVALRNAPTVDVRLWPTNDLAFELVTQGRGLPPELRVDFRGAPSADEKVRVPAGFTTCKVLKRRATCAVPAGRIDFRVTSTPSPAFIPEYFWDVDNGLGVLARLRELRLVPGSSLTGYLRDENDEPAAGASVELRTPGGRQIEPPARPVDVSKENGRAAEERLSRLHTRTNQSGFFQVRQVVPGEYGVVATHEDGRSGYVTATLEADRETALRDFLRLERPFSLDVTIDPPLSPEGDVWSITLLRLTPVTSTVRYEADSGGKATLESVGRGQYNIYVSSGGQKYFMDAFEVEEPPGPLQIKIPLVAVKGKITLGGKPLRARLIFGGENAPRSIALESSENGDFKGVLPQQGDWVVQIQASDPPVHRRLKRVSVVAGSSNEAEVDIRLKDSRLKGRVVDETGGLVGGALIGMTPMTSPEDAPTRFRTETGRFELAGMSPGMVALEAQAADQRSSESIAVTLGEVEVEALLVVSKPTELMGRVLSAASSQPIPGARLLATAADKPYSGAGLMSTDGEGQFRLRLPPRTKVTTVAYWAEGYALAIRRAAVDGNSELVLFASPVGGTLIVTLPDPEMMKGSVIVHGDAAYPPGGLATIRPEGRIAFKPGSSRVVIPNVAPGEYALCTMDAKAFQFGLSRSVGSDCSSGVLPPGGELTLSLPSDRRSH